jgi:hypothetical protein
MFVGTVPSSKAWTLEAWVFIPDPSVSGTVNAASWISVTGTSVTVSMQVGLLDSSADAVSYAIAVSFTGTRTGYINALTGWHHFAISASGAFTAPTVANPSATSPTYRIHIDGVQQFSGVATGDTAFGSAHADATASANASVNIYMGHPYAPSTGSRVILGASLSTAASFTVPTSPVGYSTIGWNGSSAALTTLGSTVYCSYVTHGKVTSAQASANTDIASRNDARYHISLAAVGAASAVTSADTIVAYASSSSTLNRSLLLSGASGQYGQATLASATGTAAFTIDLWVRPPTTLKSCGLLSTGYSGTSTGGWQISMTSAGAVQWMTEATTVRITANSALTANTWTHIAVTSTGTVDTLWINGVSAGTYTHTAINYFNYFLYVGAVRPTTSVGTPAAATTFGGYMQDIRITGGGSVRYSSNFSGSLQSAPYYSEPM